MFHILRNTLNVNKHVMYSHNVWTINDCFRRSCFTIHSLVNTLDKNQFIEDLMDEEREINYESDVSLFDIKYFTPKTLSLLNIKFNEKNTNCFNSLMTREISRANIANYVISDGIDFTTDSLTTQMKNFTDNENAINFLSSVSRVVNTKKKSGNEEAFVTRFVLNLLFGIGWKDMTPNYKISMDLMNNYSLPVRLSGRPDLLFIDKEDNIWLILELKKPNDNYSEVEKYKAQTVGYGITSFFNNLVNDSSSGVLSHNYDKQILNTRHAVLIRGMRFHFFEITINGKHLKSQQLNQTIDYTDDYIQTSNIFIDVTEWPKHGKGLNYCRFNDRIDILSALELIYSLKHRFIR
ncbi:uncharacterized protein LOC128957762 [Oppia nitens]|uniref:uncharacterized protein LOC128957762 n=1 Tax=Oppia nitens TaxID=1686743 RepID=UPI0023DCDC3B|nr:uncharacterized protein LOC128957762 [Oppia nitens]